MASQTLIFDEDGNRFESFGSCMPEFWVTVGVNLCAFQGGVLWTHDKFGYYNNFFGVQYPSSIMPVYNKDIAIRKKYLAIGYESLNNKVWAVPQIETNTVNNQTGLKQESSLKVRDFKLEETAITAHFLRDKNSMANPVKALINGGYLGGNYIAVKFEISAASSVNLVSLINPYITYEISKRNF